MDMGRGILYFQDNESFVVTYDESGKGSAASMVTESFCQVFHTVFPESKRDANIMEIPMWKHDSGGVVRLKIVQDSSRQLQTAMYLDAEDVRAFARWLCPRRHNPITPTRRA